MRLGYLENARVAEGDGRTNPGRGHRSTNRLQLAKKLDFILNALEAPGRFYKKVHKLIYIYHYACSYVKRLVLNQDQTHGPTGKAES